MMITLTEAGMASMWHLLRGYQPPRSDAAVTRSDGLDLDELLRLEMRQWWANLLDTAPPEWLPTADVAADATLMIPAAGVPVVTLPDRCRRPLTARLDGWAADAPVVPSNEANALMQLNPFTQATWRSPAALLRSRTIELHGLTPGLEPRLVSLVAVVDDTITTGIYTFDERAHATINDFSPLIPTYDF